MTRSIEQLQITFQSFAERECKAVSPLYYQLARAVAQDPYLLQLAAHARARQPVPNLFFGAVHYLLLLDSTQKLAQYYPSISKVESEEIPIALFHNFCREREEDIISILKERIVQTNALNRTAYLMPIASSIFADALSLNLIDIGCSSGLNLNFDRYQYRYNNEVRVGEGPVLISSKILEGSLPNFPEIVKVNRKIGIDQNPLDLNIPENAIWLKALIWPDLLTRFERLEAAISETGKSKIELIKGSQIADFKAVINQIPKEAPLLIYHTHVLYQFRPEERKAFRQLMDEIGHYRNFSYLAVEGHSIFDQILALPAGIQVLLTLYKNGKKDVRHLGQTNGHANWIKWKN